MADEQPTSASTWEDYRSTVDQYIGQLSDSERQALEAYTRGPGFGNASSTEQSNAAYEAAKKTLMNKFGWSDNQAGSFLATSYNVRRHPGEQIGRNANNGTVDVYSADKVNWNDPAAVKAYFGGGSGTDSSGVDSLTARINAFANSLLGPVDANDPTMQMISRKATAAGQAASGTAGIRQSSGATQYGAQVAAENLGQQYQLQRQALGNQALSLANQRDLGLSGLSLQYTQLQNGLTSAQNAAQAQQYQQAGQLIGGAVGTAAGAYFGMPQLGQVGSSLGGGVGSMMAGNPTQGMQNYSQPGLGSYGNSGSNRSGGSGF
ncbi:MAG: hypothetical protein QM729_21465 [Solirubrobacterales bacterium]